MEEVGFVSIVKFDSQLERDQVLGVAEERADQFREVPGLVQKIYLEYADGGYGAVYMWDSQESFAKFRESELAVSIPAAYQIEGAPDVTLGTVFTILN